MSSNKQKSLSLSAQPVFRLLVLSFLLIALLPVGVLGVHVYQSAWEDAWREIREKHQLLAENLAAPISIYVTDHRQLLSQLADEVVHSLGSFAGRKRIEKRIQTSLDHLQGFRALILLDYTGNTIALSHRQPELLKPSPSFADESCFVKTRMTGQWSLSGIKKSPLTGEPVIILSVPVSPDGKETTGVLLAELRVDVIEGLRRNIKFGKRGHSAIVDQFGHVIAHPNPEWMTEMRDISHLSVVKSMMAGQTGVTEFYSPFVKENMVAGYTSVPVYGWGVMVPQPKTEVSENVNALLFSHFIWVVAGILLALALAVPIARWITRPINRLAIAAEIMLNSDLKTKLPRLPRTGPREVQLLDRSFRKLVGRLQYSNLEIVELNESLQKRVEEATHQLLDANEKLEKLAKNDYLTTLFNRRYFENELTSRLNRRSSDARPICLILIDIDHFKKINDHYGHAAGDAVLIEVARVMREAMRPGDIVARYGGDEFVAQLNCGADVGIQRANELRDVFNSLSIEWEDETINVTASIGVMHCDKKLDKSLKEVLHVVDTAMYNAKKAGRNRVVELNC